MGVIVTMDYITIASVGNAADFGDLTTGRRSCGSCSNGSRGIVGGGERPGAVENSIEYWTIGSTGNASDFGDLSEGKNYTEACASDGTKGVFAGGGDIPGKSNKIEYVNMTSTGNVTDFGDLTAARQSCGGASNGTRMVIAGGTE